MAVAKTNVPPQVQIRNVSIYNDQEAAGAGMEVTDASLEDNIHAILSQINRALNGVVTSNDWFVDPPAPSAFEPGYVRGTIDLNFDLHDVERKRILKRRSMVGVGVQIVSAGDRHVVLGASELPTTTTAAVGTSTTLGTVVAHADPFDQPSLVEVVGANTLQPKNLVTLKDLATGEVVTRPDGRQIFGLFQSESATDGSTITDTTPNRVQLSFVIHNATTDDLILIDAGDMDGITFDYAYPERLAFQDCPEEGWLGDGFADTGVSTITRQATYDNQGTAAVITTTNATLELGSGLVWDLRDNDSASLLSFTEGSTSDTTTLTIGAAVDTYQNNASEVDFNSGIQVSTGASTLNLGVVSGSIEFTSAGNISATTGLILETSNGIVHVRTPSGGAITQGNSVLNLVNQGGGAGGGQSMALFTGTDAPTHSATTGSLFLRDTSTTGELYLNRSGGGSGTTWEQIQPSSAAVTRNFFQDTVSQEVLPGNPITASDLTGGELPVKPSENFNFDVDAMVFLNGMILMNGSGNEVSDGTGNQINVEGDGPTVSVGDVLTIIYHTNSTNNTA